MKTEQKSIKIKNLSLRQLRQRLFAKQSSVIYRESKYTFQDDAPEQIEALDNFTDWESFSYKWDVLWVGLDPRTLKWEVGRHNSPVRKVVSPLRIVPIDERNKRMMLVPQDRLDIEKLEVPFKEPLPESDEDRAISKALSGKVIVDEAEAEKAKRLLKSNIEELSNQLAALTQMANKLNL